MDDAFPIVVVIGLAVFGMFWIAGQSDGNFSIGGNDRPDRISVFSAEPGQVGQTNEDIRTINFGTFTVGEARGEVQAFTSERERIANGVLSGEKIVVNYNATQPGQGQVNFEVLGREAMGKIFVRVNGNEVFRAATISGATPEINISQNNFRPGMNRIVIGTTQPNPLKKAVYSIEDVEVTVEDRKFHDRTDYFQMYEHELTNFRPSNLTFQIPIDRSIPQEDLEVEVNNRQVYSQQVGRSIQTIALTPQNADLTTGYNSIQFSTEGNSRYTVENAELQVRYSMDVRPPRETFDFELSEENLRYVQRDNTVEMIRFQYQRSTAAEPIQFQLNDALYTVEPENGQNSLEVESGAFKEDNTLRIDSNQTFTMQNLQIVSEKEE
jgi:hypothetical protein